ncbi:MAG: hypothetical protein U0446_03625 [Dehalococcoidia bacterium]
MSGDPDEGWNGRPASRRDLLRLGGGLALSAFLAASCGGGGGEEVAPASTTAAPPTPAPTAELALPAGPRQPNDLVYVAVNDPPQDQFVLVQYAAGLARDFFFRQLGFYLDGPLTINVANLPALELHGATFLREGDRISTVTVNVGQATWEMEAPFERAKVVAHEYFHVLQNWLRGSTDTAADPLFLVEGAAEYAGYATVIDAGLSSWNDLRHGLEERLRNDRVTLPALDRLSDDGPLALSGYQLSALAIDRLVGAAGVQPLARYALLRSREQPPTAFELVFRRSLPDFYAEIAGWRQSSGL